MTPREMEIAAKIARLRSANMLRTQAEKDASNGSEDGSATDGGGANVKKEKRRAAVPTSFEDLPDWKKEEVMKRQMTAAEGFFGMAPSKMPATPPTPPLSRPPSSEVSVAPEKGTSPILPVPVVPTPYKPKVNTWGVFPRPANISKEYGGGRPIPLGGTRTPEEQEKAAKHDAEVQAKLATYRKGLGVDMEREKAHEMEITAALTAANASMEGSRPYAAVRELEGVIQFVSPLSQRGGDVCLLLALAYEGTGQREKARALYHKLKKSPFLVYARQARQLLAGFDAMELLQVTDETAEAGGLVTGNFELPDVAVYTDKRYETAVYGLKSNRNELGDAREANYSGASSHSGRRASIAVVLLACLISIPVAMLLLK
jgi:hypothetical protein